MKEGRKHSNERGATLIETAVSLILFFVLMLGVWEAGRLLSFQQTLNNAAREGARLAVTPLTQTSVLPTRGAVKERVNRFLQATGISNATIAINGSTGGSDSDVVGSDDLPPRTPQEVIDTGVANTRFTRVEVTVQYRVLSLSMFNFLQITLSGRALMRNETSD